MDTCISEGFGTCAGDLLFNTDDTMARVYDIDEAVWMCEGHRLDGA